MQSLTGSHRPSKVPAGQADGIQPRTIEVFQVSSGRVVLEGAIDLLSSELRSCGTPTEERKPNAHGCMRSLRMRCSGTELMPFRRRSTIPAHPAALR